MQWTLVHSSLTNVSPNTNNDVVITAALTGRYIVVFTDSLGRNPTWRRAGTLAAEWDDSTIGRVADSFWGCNFGFRRINLDDWQFLNPLVFRPKPWLINIQIKVWSTPDFDIYDKQDRIEQDLTEIKSVLLGE